MTVSQMYWLVTIPKIATTFGPILLVVGLAGLFVVFLSLSSDYDEDATKEEKKKSSTLTKRICVFSLVFFTMGIGIMTFIPSTKELIGIYGISYLTEDKNLQQIPPKLFELANIKLDELIK